MMDLLQPKFGQHKMSVAVVLNDTIFTIPLSSRPAGPINKLQTPKTPRFRIKRRISTLWSKITRGWEKVVTA